MKICPECGNTIKNDLAKFCGKCGAKQPEIVLPKDDVQEACPTSLPKESISTTEQIVSDQLEISANDQAQSVTPPPVPTNLLTGQDDNLQENKENSVQAPAISQSDNDKGSQSVKWIIWLLLVPLLLLFVVMIAYAFSQSNDDKIRISGTDEYYSVEDTVGANYIICTANGVSFKMIHVEGGSFDMGSYSGNSNESPVHRVTLTDYYIGQTEVTQELWEAVMEENPSRYAGNLSHPVENVSWNDCQRFVRKLSNITGRNFSLPTEAQWEFAARGGNKSQGYTYSGSDYLNNVAWFGYYYGGNAEGKTSPVKLKEPNELGLYDMTGNVWEWCQDEYDGGYYHRSPTYDPKCTSGDGQFVLRGGSWYSDTDLNRVTYRGRNRSSNKDAYLGLRLALSKDEIRPAVTEYGDTPSTSSSTTRIICPHCGKHKDLNSQEDLDKHINQYHKANNSSGGNNKASNQASRSRRSSATSSSCCER